MKTFPAMGVKLLCSAVAAALAFWAIPARAEDGYDLWLRYKPIDGAARAAYARDASALVVEGNGPSVHAAAHELERGLRGMLGAAPQRSAFLRDGAIVLAGPGAPDAQALGAATLGQDGFVLKATRIKGRRVVVIAGQSDLGALYGAFAYLRLLQTRTRTDRLDVRDAPHVRLRVIDHWDNLDGHVERGYAGQSLWDWHRLPDYRPTRYTDYARAEASIGVNGAVLNNVNAKAASLTRPYLEKAAALADVFRPYGVRVYLSARFSAPKDLGGLDTADPLDPSVAAWWRSKADEIYALIPDFGGFLVKANSEGQPGPQEYGRTHADGANMLADALAPHGGVVMWRAFVYNADPNGDRAKQAYDEFTPLDGRFRSNVLVQVKNGPIDFQPREPFHPLFGAMAKTPLALEVQITKEYLGFSTHLAYLGPLWREVLEADTHRRGDGSTVAKAIDGSLFGNSLSAMAGVSNVGSDRNWTGSHFDQANWYAFGRMAWDPENADPRAIARDWAAQTFTTDRRFLDPVVDMMMGSREAVVHYMTPLGLHHLMAEGTHYGPGPWVDGAARPDWNATYYHRADASGVGFERTSKGSNAVAQYAPEVAARFSSLSETPDSLLLWFHHAPWSYKMRSGRTLWDELARTYDQGPRDVEAMQRVWDRVGGYIDEDRRRDVATFLSIQAREAKWWRDACIAYFQSKSGLPLPSGIAAPPEPLAYYESLRFPYAPGQ